MVRNAAVRLGAPNIIIGLALAGVIGGSAQASIAVSKQAPRIRLSLSRHLWHLSGAATLDNAGSLSKEGVAFPEPLYISGLTLGK